ncbi:MAG: carbamoyltransferase N-terminal domain-containing protein, partial [Rhodospirillaceae bacterium]
MRILGLSALYHDSAAALLINGELVAAAQEERFTRIKHDADLPTHSIQYCLDHAGLEASDLDAVAFYEKPFLKFERLLETYAAFAPRGLTSFRLAIPVWMKEKLFQKDNLIGHLKSFDKDVDWAKKLVFSEHHLSHAASAFFPSPFEKAAV